MSNWLNDSKWEKDWWSNCANSYGEEEKQLVYAQRMGLKLFHNSKTPYNFTVSGKVLDIGGGPVSLLLKCPNARGKVVDPCEYPSWVEERYKCASIEYEKTRGEDLSETGYDEVWFYNVLQHTEDPEKICKNALRAGKIIRCFEWIDTYKSPGHPQVLTEALLNEWLQGYGKVEIMPKSMYCQKAYYGIFKGLDYNQ